MFSKSQYFAIFAAIVLVVLLYFAPNKPPLKEKNSETEEKSLDEKLALAVSYVEDGKEPMKGIMLLREILEKDSNNVKANFYLGVFSVQSNQWEKATMRFEKVLQLDSTNSEAYFYLATAQKNSGDTIKAIENFEKYMNFIQDENRKNEVQTYINELKNKH